ncbi:hypothetical protein SI65_01322 [Aspergillus cristatus]|uniref:Potassium transport protein n=1 Tax=Aspergillus cristatus TaxID=573508 RepID=A0A1E3BRY0_ASPCR|nr:hypothetical protein SI65_01322 [Aspergillus cristatus]
MVTSPIFIHTAVVFVRIYWFEKRFQHLVQSARIIRRTGSMSGRSSLDVEQQSSKRRISGSSLVIDAYNDITAGTSRRSSDDNASNTQPEGTSDVGNRDETPYLSWNATPGRNSTFIGLTEAQRDELGGIEYRSLKTLAVILISYYLFFHVFGIICLVPWIMRSTKYGPVIHQAGQGRPWWGVFTAGSAFNDFGLTITPDSMESFQQAAFPLLVMSFLIIIGNTAFPCMLRFIIWTLSIVVRRDTPLWYELRFLLDHPRRCFTLLFPQKATWWLFATVIALNVVNMVVLIVLNLDNPDIKAMSSGTRFVDSLFQACSTRTAGFSITDLSNIHPGTLVCYLVLMYISVFPIAISVRRTNVYEERSVGVYSSADDHEQERNTKQPSFVGIHLRRQLGSDLWYIFLGLFIIAIVEGGRLAIFKLPSFNIFAVFFEIVSAYGTIGLSLGYSTGNTSFVGQFQTISKLVIIAMQIRGRHRGLPYALDRSVLLPSESIHKSELAQAEENIPLNQYVGGDQGAHHFLGAAGERPQLPQGAVGEGARGEHRLGIGTAMSTLAGAS